MATNGDGGKVEDPALLEMQKLVKDAFSIFDHENNDTVDMREVGTIIRCEFVQLKIIVQFIDLLLSNLFLRSVKLQTQSSLYNRRGR